MSIQTSFLVFTLFFGSGLGFVQGEEVASAGPVITVDDSGDVISCKLTTRPPPEITPPPPPPPPPQLQLQALLEGGNFIVRFPRGQGGHLRNGEYFLYEDSNCSQRHAPWEGFPGTFKLEEEHRAIEIPLPPNDGTARPVPANTHAGKIYIGPSSNQATAPTCFEIENFQALDLTALGSVEGPRTDTPTPPVTPVRPVQTETTAGPVDFRLRGEIDLPFNDLDGHTLGLNFSEDAERFQLVFDRNRNLCQEGDRDLTGDKLVETDRRSRDVQTLSRGGYRLTGARSTVWPARRTFDDIEIRKDASRSQTFYVLAEVGEDPNNRTQIQCIRLPYNRIRPNGAMFMLDRLEPDHSRLKFSYKDGSKGPCTGNPEDEIEMIPKENVSITKYSYQDGTDVVVPPTSVPWPRRTHVRLALPITDEQGSGPLFYGKAYNPLYVQVDDGSCVNLGMVEIPDRPSQ